MQTKGYAARETKACLEKAHLLIKRAEALGESTEDPLALFSILYGVWVSNLAAFNSNSVRNLAAQFVTLAQQQGRTLPLALGHRLIGGSLLFAGDIAEGRAHLDRAVEFYDPHEHRPLATRFGQDVGVVILSNRAVGLWLLGYPGAARADIDRALSCGALLKPKPGDCCVFCSYGDVPCPPIQEARRGSANSDAIRPPIPI